MRKLLMFACVAALVLGTGAVASAWEITASDLTEGAHFVDLGFATATANPEQGDVFVHKTFDAVPADAFTGVGVSGGYVGDEIDADGGAYNANGKPLPEYIELCFQTASRIDEILLGFLFEKPAHNDLVNEKANIRYLVDGIWETITMAVVTETTATLSSGPGTVQNVLPGLQDRGGLWKILNPFGDLLVKKIQFRGYRNPNNLSSAGSDYVLVSVNSVPEPSTVLLLGAGLLGLLAYGRKHMNK